MPSPVAPTGDAAQASTPQTHGGPSRMFGPLHALEAVQQIAHSASQGHARLEIRLKPAHLGTVHVSLQTDAAKQLMVHITAEQPAAQQAIQQHLPQLRLALESQGMQPGAFSLSAGMSHDGGGQWQGSSPHSQGAAGQSGPNTPATTQTGDSGDAPSRAPAPYAGRLSIRA